MFPILENSDTAGGRERLVESLRAEVQRLEGAPLGRDETLFGSGCAALDRLLPEGGWRRGRLVEWLETTAGSGAGTLALIVARQAAMEGGVVVVMDRQRQFYPPAAAAWGVDLEKLIVVRPRQPHDEIWALDQVLRCVGVAAVWGMLDRLDWRSFRRLQLAAECGGSLGLLLRPASVRGQPSWAHAQLAVEPSVGEPSVGGASVGGASVGGGQLLNGEGARGGLRRVRVELTRSAQGGLPVQDGRGPVVELEVDETSGVIHPVSGRHETHPLHLADPLAPAATPRRSARA